MVDRFLRNMYGGSRADFVYSVSRDSVRSCQTPVLVMPAARRLTPGGTP